MPRFTSTIVLTTEVDRRRAIREIESLLLGVSPPWSVRIEPRTLGRTRGQRAQYRLLLAEIAEKTRTEARNVTPTALHRYFKSEFLVGEEVSLPDGTTGIEYPSTERLSEEEWRTYLHSIEARVVGEWGVELGAGGEFLARARRGMR